MVESLLFIGAGARAGVRARAGEENTRSRPKTDRLTNEFGIDFADLLQIRHNLKFKA